MQADWLTLENNEKATLNINVPYSKLCSNDYISIRAETLIFFFYPIQIHKMNDVAYREQ